MGLRIDGIATNSALDTSGEILDIHGHDISDLIEGRGVLNFEHEKGAEDIIGAIVYAKKILSIEDCENERQLKYWQLSRGPYVYIIAELLDSEDHPGAVAVAAMIRYYAKKHEKMFMGFSIEGTTLERDGQVLKRSVGRRVAFTLRPCNRSAIFEVLDDPKLIATVQKYEHLPARGEYEIDTPILSDGVSRADTIADLRKAIAQLHKTLTAGDAGAAPSQRVGGSALARESLDGVMHNVGMKNRLKAAVRDWNRLRPLKDAIKAALPEISDDYLDHFVTLAEDITLKKGQVIPKLQRIGVQDLDYSYADEDQQRLIDGLYYDQNDDQWYFGHRPFIRMADQTALSGVTQPVNDYGDKVVIRQVQPHEDPSGVSDTAAASLEYYQLAKLLGLVQFVLPVSSFRYAKGPDRLLATKVLPDARTLFSGLLPKAMQKVDQYRSDGTLQKLCIMDWLLGASHGRHPGTICISQDGDLYHIDNIGAFQWQRPSCSVYLNEELQSPLYIGDQSLHVDVQSWLNNLKPKHVAAIMAQHGIKRHGIKIVLQLLTLIRKMGRSGATLQDISVAATQLLEAQELS